MNKEMKRNSKIALSALLLASLISSISVKAATVNVNQLYANAYNATVNALSLKTQKSVNSARTAIDTLKGTSAAAYIGEFSKQVDTVQHPILVKAVNAITTAQNTSTQVNINTAKASIDPDMPAVWRNSYSSAVDVVQQKLIKTAFDAYNAALQSNLQADVDTASLKLSELKTAADTSVVNWANTIQLQVNAIQIQPGIKMGTLGSVSITANGVSLTKTVAPHPYKTNVYNITYTDGKNINSVTPLYIDNLQAAYSIPAIGTSGFADVYDLLLNNIANNLYINSAAAALNVNYIDTNATPVSITLNLQGNNIIYTATSSFYKTVKYTFTPTGTGAFSLSY